MYHCKICGALSPPKQPLLRYTITRTVPMARGGVRTEIASELPVCRPCKSRLDDGFSVSALTELMGGAIKRKPVKQHPPKPAPVEPLPAAHEITPLKPLSALAMFGQK